MAPAIKNERGSILVHVLVTSIVVGVIAAGLMSVLMLQYTAAYRAEQSVKGKKDVDLALNALISYWNQNGICSNFAGFTCGAASPPCTCSDGSRTVTVPASMDATLKVYKITIQSTSF